jgi:hypothetical protein
VLSAINSTSNVTTSADVNANNVNSFGFYGNAVEVESHVWVGNTGNSIWTAGNITGDNVIANSVSSTGIISATGNINTPADINSNTVNSFGFYGNSVEVESHVWVGSTGNSVWTSGNVTGNNVIANSVSSTGNITGNNVSAVNLMVLPTHATDPTGIQGGIYYNTTYNTFRVFNGSLWANITTTL